MIKPLKFLSVILAGIVSLSSCEKVIDLELETSPNQLVIEGNLTNQSGMQVIKISRSEPYTNSSIYPPVTGAIVTITDDTGRSISFAETSPGNYTFPSFKGQTGIRYILKVNVNNVIYTASSTMPTPVTIDSLSINTITFGGEESKQVQVHYKDPVDDINQYRFVLKINGIQTKRIYVDNDRFNNGNEVTNVLFYFDDDNKELASGDKVEVEIQCLDRNIFTYWNSLSQQTQNGPGGGVTPANPPSNLNNNALGYFSAHTTVLKALTIK